MCKYLVAILLKGLFYENWLPISRFLLFGQISAFSVQKYVKVKVLFWEASASTKSTVKICLKPLEHMKTNEKCF